MSYNDDNPLNPDTKRSDDVNTTDNDRLYQKAATAAEKIGGENTVFNVYTSDNEPSYEWHSKDYAPETRIETVDAYTPASEAPICTGCPAYRDYMKKKKNRGAKVFGKVIGIVAGVFVIGFAAIGLNNVISGTPVASSTDNSFKAQTTTPDKNKNVKSEDLSVSDISSAVSPAVVSIVCEVQSANNNFNSFFNGGDQVAASSGTGMLMSSDGYILTNNHVVDGARAITVTTADGNEHKGTVVGTDASLDIAVVKIEGKNLPTVTFGDSDTLAVGDAVVAIGNPLGTELIGTVTTGIVSYLNRSLTIDGETNEYIQTDASINSGNSGGPLVDSQGLVIGINTAKTSEGEGIGFALPINDVVEAVNDIIEYGYVKGRPYIGITGQDITEDVSGYYKLPIGVYIVSVEEKSPAAKSGLSIGDVITKINGIEVDSMDTLNNEKNKCKPGEEITLTIYRSGEKKKIKVTLGEQTN